MVGKVGHPTDYKEKYCEELIQYFSDETEVFQTIEEFASKIRVSDDTIVNWTRAHPEFLAAYNYAKQKQKTKLIKNGLIETYNSNFAKFVGVNLGMKDKIEIINTDEVIRTAKDIIQTALTYIPKVKQAEFIATCEKVLSEFSTN